MALPKTLAVYCAGGFGKETAYLAQIINRWEKIVFVDDVTNERTVNGIKVYRYEEIERIDGDIEFIVATGEPHDRCALYNKLKDEQKAIATLIHPACGIAPECRVGEGCIIWDAGLSINVLVGNNCVVNTKVTVGHDAVIGDNSVISARAFVGGRTVVGKETYIAPGCLLKDRITIGDGAIVGLGSVVLRGVRPNSIVLGNPAKKIGKNETKHVFEVF